MSINGILIKFYVHCHAILKHINLKFHYVLITGYLAMVNFMDFKRAVT